MKICGNVRFDYSLMSFDCEFSCHRLMAIKFWCKVKHYIHKLQIILFSGQVKFRTGEEVLMGLLPFYHIYGLMVVQFLSLAMGAKVIVHPRFDAEQFLKSIQDYRVSTRVFS